MENSKVYTLAGGEIVLWADIGSVMLKMVEPRGDPVELGEHEAEELIAVLTRLLAEIAGW